MRLLTIAAILISLTGLHGCTTKTIAEKEAQDLFMVNITPVDPIIVYDSGDIDTAMQKLRQIKLEPVGKINLLDVPVFNRLHKVGKMPYKRAYAIGYPYTVGGSWAYWGFDNPVTPAHLSLKNCLALSKTKESHLPVKAGTQLILWDNHLLVHPDNLPKSFSASYVAKIRTSSGKTDISYGMLHNEGPGKNLPLKLFDHTGKLVAEGNYSLTSLQAVFDTGRFKLTYYPENVTFEGRFTTKRIKLKNLPSYFRISKGQAALPDGRKITFVTGVTVDQIDDYPDLLE